MTWNIANLGVQERRPEDCRLLAEILSWCDIAAIEEVNNDLTGLRELQAQLPAHYRVLFSDPAGTNERIAFLYDERKVILGEEVGEVAVSPSQLRYIFDFDGALFKTLWESRSRADFLAYLRYYVSDHRPMWVEFAIYARRELRSARAAAIRSLSARHEADALPSCWPLGARGGRRTRSWLNALPRPATTWKLLAGPTGPVRRRG